MITIFYRTVYTWQLDRPALIAPGTPTAANPPAARVQIVSKADKKLSYRRGTARCVVSAEILPTATQQCRNYLYDKSLNQVSAVAD